MPLKPSQHSNSQRPASLPLAIGVWALLAGICWYSLAAYGFKYDGGAENSEVADVWPSDSHLPRIADSRQLLVVVHPKCPCSQATITELSSVLADAKVAGIAAPQVTIVAAIPADAGGSDKWRHTALLDRAGKLLTAEVVFDIGGVESQRFGVHTSGTVLLFDRNGRRLYAGGVTAARGHEGSNLGADSLTQLLRDEGAAVKALPPLGCPLVMEASRECSGPCPPAQGASE